MENKSVRKIDIINIIRYVFKKWLIVLVTAVLFAGAIGGYEYFKYKVQQSNELYANAHRIEPIYGSFVIYINNFDDNDSFVNRIDDVTSIIKGYSSINNLIEKNNLSANMNIMTNCITAVSVGVNQLEISVEGSLIGLNQEQVVDLTQQLCDYTVDSFTRNFGKNSIIVMDEPHAGAYALENSIKMDDDKIKKITKKQVVKSGILGGIIGVAAGIVFVVFYVLISTVLRSKTEVLESYGFSLLGDVDKDGKNKEEYRRAAGLLKNLQVLLAVSLTDKEYRNETVENLAGVLAVNGKKALIMRIAEDTSCESNGLYQYIAGKKSMKELLKESGRTCIKYMECTTASTDDIDLFTHDKFAVLIEEIKKEFDVVLIDAPALIDSMAGLNIAPLSDGIVMVASRNAVKEADVDKIKYSFELNRIACTGMIYVE